MNTLPIASYLATELVRQQFEPNSRPEYVYDPIKLPRLRTARSVMARSLHATAAFISPSVEPRLSSAS